MWKEHLVYEKDCHDKYVVYKQESHNTCFLLHFEIVSKGNQEEYCQNKTLKDYVDDNP